MSDIDELLRDLDQALRCWLHYYAPEHCEADRVENYAALVREHGGTVAYIGELHARIKAIVEAEKL